MLCVQFLFWYIAHNWNYGILVTPSRTIVKTRLNKLQHGLFKKGWEKRSRDVWKPVSNRTPGIISKLCKLGGGTPALLRPVGTLQDFALLDMGKMTPAR